MPACKPNVISWTEIGNPDAGALPPTNPDDPLYAWRLLAEGDSWFSLGALPSSNLLFDLKLARQSIVVNCATPGDTIRNMGQIAHNIGLSRMLRAGYRWDALLVSGGGNDLIDGLDRVLVARPAAGAPSAACIDEAGLEAVLEDIAAGYRKLVRARDEHLGPEVPIIIHTYDYPTPRPSPARFFSVGLAGPWLYEALKATQIPPAQWPEVSDLIMCRLAEWLTEMPARNGFSAFHVVETRDTLRRAKPGEFFESGDWRNEIHPSNAGYVKLGKKLANKINALLKTDRKAG